jgi:putative addiction module component (TIGR02574 family)
MGLTRSQRGPWRAGITELKVTPDDGELRAVTLRCRTFALASKRSLCRTRLEALPADDRAALAESLLASLEADDEEDAEAAWVSEIERRVADLDAGTVQTIPWPEVRRRPFERARHRAVKRLRNGLDLQWVLARSREDLHRR